MVSNELSLIAILDIQGTILCRTGLHIGGNMENFHISNLDSPIIRDTLTRFPYIPGSSLKGKVRALLEVSLGKYTQNKGSFLNCSCNDCEICRIFGVEASVRLAQGKIKGPSRLSVQDAYPEGFTEELFFCDNPDITKGTTIERWENLDSGLLYTEWKKENSLDRITSAANPRDIERIPAGSKFILSLSYLIFEESDIEALSLLMSGLQLLENSYLGGSGTRGYGKVCISLDKINLSTKEDFFTVNGKERQILKGIKNPSEIKGKIVSEIRQVLGLTSSRKNNKAPVERKGKKKIIEDDKKQENGPSEGEKSNLKKASETKRTEKEPVESEKSEVEKIEKTGEQEKIQEIHENAIPTVEKISEEGGKESSPQESSVEGGENKGKENNPEA